MPADHPRRAVYVELTAELERRGMMVEMAGMGFKQPWAARLAAAGIRIDDQAIAAVAEPPAARPPASTAPTIARHKTAIVRERLSAPMQALYRFGLIADATSVLDYGCGQGDDVRTLAAAGIDAVGWDPHHRPDDAVNRPGFPGGRGQPLRHPRGRAHGGIGLKQTSLRETQGGSAMSARRPTSARRSAAAIPTATRPRRSIRRQAP